MEVATNNVMGMHEQQDSKVCGGIYEIFLVLQWPIYLWVYKKKITITNQIVIDNVVIAHCGRENHWYHVGANK